MNWSLIPAFGRDYKSTKKVEEDLAANKDFMICDLSNPDHGRYLNLSQTKDGDELSIRYQKMTKVAVIDVTKFRKKLLK